VGAGDKKGVEKGNEPELIVKWAMPAVACHNMNN